MNLSNIQNEILLVGSLFKSPDLYLSYGVHIRSKYDFSDEATKFFYDAFDLMYKTFSQDTSEFNVNTFMTQNDERYSTYKRYGGYKLIKNWMDMSNIEDAKNYFDTVKKYSLLREYHRKGNIPERVLNFKNFNTMTALDVSRAIISSMNKISTVILANEDSKVVNKDMKNTVNKHLKTPKFGLQYPYPILSEVFKGMREQHMICFGMLSNEGKTRFMTKLVAYISCFHQEKTCILLNEMTEESFRDCLLTTVINNKEFQELHGINVFKNEKELTLGLYVDENGEYMSREVDEFGEYIESEEAYVERVEKNSEEYRRIVQVAEWLETQPQILVKELVEYDDITLEFEIKKHQTVHGCKYYFYDTLKNDNDSIGDWSALKKTTTALKELANQLKVYVYGSIQLSDDTVFTDPFQMSSNNIANCKQLKHLVDALCLCKRLDKDNYHNYCYVPNNTDWGDNSTLDLDPRKKYYCCVVDKNRDGEKPIVLFEVDLNRNTWYEIGELKKALKKPKKE